MELLAGVLALVERYGLQSVGMVALGFALWRLFEAVRQILVRASQIAAQRSASQDRVSEGGLDLADGLRADLRKAHDFGYEQQRRIEDMQRQAVEMAQIYRDMQAKSLDQMQAAALSLDANTRTNKALVEKMTNLATLFEDVEKRLALFVKSIDDRLEAIETRITLIEFRLSNEQEQTP